MHFNLFLDPLGSRQSSLRSDLGKWTIALQLWNIQYKTQLVRTAGVPWGLDLDLDFNSISLPYAHNPIPTEP